MIPYDDDTQNSITVLGAQYMVQPDENFCGGCAFRDPIYRLLITTPCLDIPCASSDRKDDQDVIFVEVSNV